MSSVKSLCYSLDPAIQVWPLDVSTKDERYLVEVGNQRRFEVNRGVVQIIELLKAGRTFEEIAESLRHHGLPRATSENVAEVVEKVLVPRGIVQPVDGSPPPPLAASNSNYLRFKIPLLSSASVRPFVNLLLPLFRPRIFTTILLVILAFHAYFYWKILPGFAWSAFSLPTSQYFLLCVALQLTTMLHELGHAAACRYYGCEHGKIGFGIYLYFPVFYTDVSAVWRLGRWQRAMVDFAGMYMEMLVALAAIVTYCFNREPILIYAVLFLNLSIFGSLNPVLRRDGYWLLADLVGQARLREAGLEVLRGGALWLLRRSPKPSRILMDMPAQSRWTIYIYSVVTVVFTAYMVGWMAWRIVRDLIPGIPRLLVAMGQSLRFSGGDFLVFLQLLAQLSISLLFSYFVLSLAWNLALAVLRWLRSLFSQQYAAR